MVLGYPALDFLLAIKFQNFAYEERQTFAILEFLMWLKSMQIFHKGVGQPQFHKSVEKVGGYGIKPILA